MYKKYYDTWITFRYIPQTKPICHSAWCSKAVLLALSFTVDDTGLYHKDYTNGLVKSLASSVSVMELGNFLH